MRRVLAVLLLVLVSTTADSAGRELAPRPIGATPWFAYSPRTASSHDRFLTTWSEAMGPIGVATRASFSDANGHRATDAFTLDASSFVIGVDDGWAAFSASTINFLDAAGRVTATHSLDLPIPSDAAAAWNGTYFLLAYQFRTGYPWRSEAALIDRDGRIVRHGIPLGADAGFAITPVDGGFILITSGYNNGVVAHRIANDGTVATHVLDATGRSFTSAKDANGDVFVLWAADEQLQGTVVAARDGTAGATRKYAISLRVTQTVHLMRTGNDYLLLYRTPAANSQFMLATAKIHADGTTSGAAAIVSAGTPDTVTAASNGTSILASYATPEYQIDTIAIAADGSASAPERRSFARERHAPPAVGSTGAGALAAWTAFSGGVASLGTARITPDAGIIDGPRLTPTLLATRDLAWNGAEALTVVFNGSALVAVRLDANGSVAGTSVLIERMSWNPNWNTTVPVVWAGDRWIVVLPWQPFLFATVTPSGVVTTRELPFNPVPTKPNWFGGATAVAAAFDGTNVLLVWTEQFGECLDWCRTTHTFTRMARVTRDGNAIDATSIEIPVEGILSAASSGAEVALLADTTLYIIDTHGAAPKITASTQVLNWHGQGDVTWDGIDYVVALRYDGARWYTSLSRFDRALRATSPMRAIPTRAPDEIMPPSVAAVAPRSAVVAVNEGDVENGVAAVVYVENEIPVAPARPRPPQQVVALIAGAFTREIRWLPSDDADLYRVEEWSPEDGLWVGVATRTPDQPLRVVANVRPIRVIAFNAGGASEPAEAGPPQPLPRRRSARP